MRERIYEIVERAEEGDTVSSVYDIFIAIVAVISVAKLLTDAGGATPEIAAFVDWVDEAAVCILFFDYMLRWITYDIKCDELGITRADGSPLGWLAFLFYPFTLLALLELIGLLPSLVPMPAIFNYLMLLRLLKVVRVLNGLSIIRKVFIREGRTLLSIFGIAVLYVMCIALIMYTLEPDTFNDFLDAIYWSTTALATIGYGDLYPHTQIGKLINILSALVGIAVVALPSGIIAGGYVTEMRRQREKGVRSKRGIDRDYSLSERIEDRTVQTGKNIKKGRLIRYFKNNPRVVRYAVVIAILAFIDMVSYALWAKGVVPVCFDLAGTSFAAFLLEPAAGVVVGFIASLWYAFAYGDTTHILYYVVYVIWAVVFGRVLSAKGTPNVKRDILKLLALSLGSTALYMIIWWLDGCVFNASSAAVAALVEGMSFGYQLGYYSAITFAFLAVQSAVLYVIVLLLRPVRRYLKKCDERDRQRAAESRAVEKQMLEEENEAVEGAQAQEGDVSAAASSEGEQVSEVARTQADEVPEEEAVASREVQAEKKEEVQADVADEADKVEEVRT